MTSSSRAPLHSDRYHTEPLVDLMLCLINTCEQDPEMFQLLDGGRNSLPTLHSRFLHTWTQTGSKCYGGHEGPHLLQQEEMHLTSSVQWILTKCMSLNHYVTSIRIRSVDSILDMDLINRCCWNPPSVNMSGGINDVKQWIVWFTD